MHAAVGRSVCASLFKEGSARSRGVPIRQGPSAAIRPVSPQLLVLGKEAFQTVQSVLEGLPIRPDSQRE